MTMANTDLVFYVRLWVKPDRVDEWLSAVKPLIEQMSRESAFVSCYMHRDANDATQRREPAAANPTALHWPDDEGGLTREAGARPHASGDLDG